MDRRLFLKSLAGTIAYIFGLDIPGDWRGKPMMQIFK